MTAGPCQCRNDVAAALPAQPADGEPRTAAGRALGHRLVMLQRDYYHITDDILAIETEAAQPAPGLDAADLETLEKALAIGFISWDGDDWYAGDRGYIDADETFAAAQAIVARLRGGER